MFQHPDRARWSSPLLARTGWALTLVLILARPVSAAEPVEEVRAGDRLPPGTYTIFNPGDGPAEVDLANVLGVKPVVFYYWIPGSKRADEVFADVLALSRKIDRAKIAIYGVATPNPGVGVTPDVVRAKIQELGVDLPVLLDEGFVLGKRLAVRSVPHLSLVDAGGVLRLANGASLKQVLEYKLDLGTAIERLAAGGSLLTYGYLDTYYPVRELAGQPAPEFSAPLLTSSVAQSFGQMIDRDKLNVLIFWSVNCPHCRVSLPEINSWIKDNPDGINVLSCASVTNPTMRAKTREFCETQGLSFPTLVDEDSRIGSLYKVTATPTIVIIGPDGIVDSAITSSHTDFGSIIERKKKELLKPAGSAGGLGG